MTSSVDSTSFSSSQRIYAHVLGGGSIASSGLEGCNATQTLSYLSLVLGKIGGIDSSLINQIDGCQTWIKKLRSDAEGNLDEVCEGILANVNKLKNGESLLLPGGWKGDPYGHVMLYELTKTNDTFMIRIINTGDGAQFHCAVRDYKKRRTLACATYAEIPYEDIFYGEGDLSFLRVLMKLNVVENPGSFDAGVIYNGIFRPLIAYRCDQVTVDLGDLWITPQRVGICSWAAPMAYLRLKLGKEEYKQVYVSIKAKALKEFFHEVKNNLTEVDLNLLQVGYQNLSRYLLKLTEKCITIREDIFAEAQNNIKEVYLFLKEQPKLTFEVEPLVFSREYPKVKVFEGKSTVTKRLLVNNFVPSLNKTQLKVDQHNLSQEIEKIFEKIEEVNCSDIEVSPVLTYLVEDFAFSINCLQGPWENTLSFDGVFKLFNFYQGEVFKAGGPSTPRQINTALTFYLCLWNMFPNSDVCKSSFTVPQETIRKLMQNLVPPENLFGELDKNPFFIIFEKKDLLRFQILRDAFARIEVGEENKIDIFSTYYQAEVKQYPREDDYRDEFFFYEKIRDSLKESLDVKWGYIHSDLAKEYEQIGLLAVVDERIWKKAIPNFPNFRKAYCLMNSFLGGTGFSTRCYEVKDNSLRISDDGFKYGPFEKRKNVYDNRENFYGYKKQREFPKILTSAFEQKPFLNRLGEYESSCEEAALVEVNSLELKTSSGEEEEDSFLEMSASISTMHSLQFVHLLTLFNQYAHYLKRDDFRNLFITQFFKVTTNTQQSLSRELKENPSIIKQVIKFASYVEDLSLEQDGQVDFKMKLFASFVLQGIYCYLDNSPINKHEESKGEELDSLQPIEEKLLDQKKHIDLIIKEMSANRSEKDNQDILRIAHLHRLHFYSVFEKNESLSKRELSEVLSSYFVIKDLGAIEDDHYLFLKKTIEPFVLSQFPLNNWSNKELKSLAVQICRELGYGSIVDMQRASFCENNLEKNQLKLNLKETDIVLNLSTGTVLVDGLIVSRNFKDSGIEERHYIQLFGDQHYPSFKIGDCFYLEHPEGLFNCISGVIRFKPKGEEKWYLFGSILSTGIPKKFTLNHNYFYDDSKREWIFIKDRNYSSFASAYRCHLNDTEISSKEYFYSLATCEELEKIEIAEFIQKRRDLQGNEWVELPRYNLTFEVDPLTRKLMWQENTDFRLMNNKNPKSIKGLSQTLVLENSIGEQLLIIPQLNFIGGYKGQFKGLTSSYLLGREISGKDCDLSYRVYRIFAKENQEIELEPTDQEGFFVLAVNYLQVREYLKSLSLLKNISDFDDLSNESIELLNNLLSYGSTQKHESPEVIAVLLHAIVLSLKKVFVTKEDKELRRVKLSVLYRKYLEREGQIPLELRLNHNQEIFIIKCMEADFQENFGIKHIDDIFQNRLNYLNKEKCKVNVFLPLSDDLKEIKSDFSILGHLNTDVDSAVKPNYVDLDVKYQPGLFIFYYDAIRLKTFSKREMETALWMHVPLAKDASINDLNSLLILFNESYNKDRELPDHNFPEKASSSNKQERLDLRNSFINEVYTFAIGCSYKLPVLSNDISVGKSVDDYVKAPEELPSSYIESHFDVVNEEKFHEKIGIALPEVNLDLGLTDYSSFLRVVEDNPLYKTCINREFESVNDDLKEGIKRLSEERLLEGKSKEWFLKDLSAWERLKIVKGKIEDYNRRKNFYLIHLKKIFCEKANLQVNQETVLGQEHLASLSKRTPYLTLEIIEDAFLWNDVTIVAGANPAFRGKIFQEFIKGLLAKYEQGAIELEIGKRALKFAENSLKEGTSFLEREVATQQLVESLEFSLSHITSQLTVEQNTFLNPLTLLIFAQRTKLIPRADQLSDIMCLREGSCTLQKIMGGGKTSVIAALWAFLMSKEGLYLPVIFSERSLHQSLGDNLKKSQKTAFGQGIFTIKVDHKKITEESLRDNLRDLKEGKQENKILVMCPETLQMLDLELQKIVKKNDESLKIKKELLQEVMIFFKKKTVTLGDEIDLLLRHDFEVNIPYGVKKRLTPKRIDLIKEIFSYFVKDKNLAFVGLKDNLQGLVNKDGFEFINRFLAEKLLTDPRLKLFQESEIIKEGFVSYMTRKPGEDFAKEFEEYVNKLALSENSYDQEAAELIALSYHCIRDLIPVVFEQSSGVDFGRVDKKTGKVGPFLGVKSPSDRELAYHYEAVCKHMITVIQQGIELGQLKDIHKHFSNEAERERGLKKCSLQATNAYKDFYDVIGHRLEDCFNADALQNVLEEINSNPVKGLNLEVETAFRHVSYYAKYYHSSAQALANLVESLRGMTATPWNEKGYNKKVGNLVKDKGAEGKVICALLDRKLAPVYSLKEDSIENLIDVSMEGGLPFPDVILDLGAIFSTEEFDQLGRKYLQKALDLRIPKKAVLFFHRKEGERISNRLAIGQFVKGEFIISLLENSSLEALKAKGLSPNECITFYDERHTTGTDIPLPISARAIMTCNEKIKLRSFLQTVMRLRRFCSTQSVDFALLKKCHEFVKGEDQNLTVVKLLCLSIVNQACKKADSLFASFKQQIDEVFIDRYREKTRTGEASYESLQNLYESFVESEAEDSPFKQFFKDACLTSPIVVIKSYAQKKLDQFKAKLASMSMLERRYLNEELQEIEKGIRDVVDQAQEKENLQVLGNLVLDPNNTIGNEIETEAQVQSDVKVEQDVNQDLVRELEGLRGSNDAVDIKHQPWWSEDESTKSVEDFIRSVKDKAANESVSHKANLMSLPNLFKQVNYGLWRSFNKMFSNNIFATDMFRLSKAIALPVFSKSQKLAEHVLVVELESKGHAFVILSAVETNFLKRELSKNNRTDVWLVNASGNQLLDSPVPFPLNYSSIGRGLTEINIFSGRATSIESLPGGHVYFQMWMQGNQGKEKDKRDYLELRSFHRPKIDNLKRLTKSIDPDTIAGLRHSLSPQEVRELKDEESIFLLKAEDLPYITSRQVPYIRIELLPLLKVKEAIQAVPFEKLVNLSPEQYKFFSKEQMLEFSNHELIGGVRSIPKEVIELLTKEDLLNPENVRFLKALNKEQSSWINVKLEKEKIDLLKEQGVRYLFASCLKDKDICKLDNPEEINLLKDGQLKFLVSKQVPYLEKSRVNKLDSKMLRFLTSEQVSCVNISSAKKLAGKNVQYASFSQVFGMRVWQVFDMTFSQKIFFVFSRTIIIGAGFIFVRSTVHMIPLNYRNISKENPYLGRYFMYFLSLSKIKHSLKKE
jgi:hypothetical protein